MVLAILIPMIAWAACYAICRALAARRAIHADRRLSWVLASVAWSVLLTLVVEVPGAFHLFTRPVVMGLWLVMGGALAGVAIAMRVKTKPPRESSAAPRAGAWWSTLPLDARIFAGVTVLLVALIGVIAVETTTTNYDSMTYHLPRVAHIVDQRGPEHYPTTDFRQIEFGPWSEFAMANLYLLEADDDRSLNLVQWFSMVTSVLAASLIAQMLLPGWKPRGPDAPAAEASSGSGAGASVGASVSASVSAAARARISVMTALLVATMPLGIAQAMTTQNDYVLAAFLTCAVVLCLALYYDASNVWYTWGLGAALGAGFLTKSTMALFSAPFVALTLLFLLLRLKGTWPRLRMLLILGVAFFAMNGPHMARNYALYGSPTGSKQAMDLLRNKTVTVSGTISNVARNLATYSGTGSETVSKAIDDAVIWVHAMIGRSLNDRDITFPPVNFAFEHRFIVGDSGATSIFHLAAGTIVLVLLIVRGRRRVADRAWLFTYAGLIIVSFVLFCALLRWQPWHSRFHMGQFVLFAPLVAIVLTLTLPAWLSSAVGLGFIVLAGVSLDVNISRPITDGDFMRQPREQQYFQQSANGYPLYRDAADLIAASGCQNIGLRLPFGAWEYPLWIMLRHRHFTGRMYSDFRGMNDAALPIEARIPSTDPLPCLIVTQNTPLTGELRSTFTYRYPILANPPDAMSLWMTDAGSRWAQVTRLSRSEWLAVAPKESRLPLTSARARLTLRSMRPGTLKLTIAGLHGATANAGSGSGSGSEPGSESRSASNSREQSRKLELRAGAYLERQELTTGPVTFEIPTTGGKTTITLRLMGTPPAGDVWLEDVTWTFVPGS